MRYYGTTPHTCEQCGAMFYTWPGHSQRCCSMACRNERRAQQAPERFWNSFNRTPSGCWLWQKKVHPLTGYGSVGYQSKDWLVHRLAWTLTNGPIPKGMNVLHRCDVRHCGNPTHLFLGTQSDNIIDMYRKSRGGARLTPDDIRTIRTRHAAGGISYKDLAQEYGVSKSAIEGAVSRRKWAWLP